MPNICCNGDNTKFNYHYFSEEIHKSQTIQEEKNMNTFVLRKILTTILGLALFTSVHRVAAQTANIPAVVLRPAKGESHYDFQMRLGYAAAQREDYATALIRFRDALYVRPNDRNATIAYYNMLDILDGNKPKSIDSPKSAYDRYMRIGYSATENQDYQTALINFRRALQKRPNDPYASQAIRNIRTYINRGNK